MDTDIDYKAICEQLQHELETARLNIIRLRQERVLHINPNSIKQFLRDNYVVISAVACLVFVFLAFFDTVKGIFTKHTKE